jgi:glycosyltransferase involved in cell wall biosynthesis
MRILQVNDVANVGSTLAAGLKQLGHISELQRLHLVAGRRSTAIKLLALPWRLQELAATNWRIKAAHYDVVHIHFAYLGWLGISGRYPYVLHCHGSDVRRDLHDVIRRWPIIQSLKHAQSVLFSTPDLAAIIQPIRPDAIFLPNPINTDRFQPLARSDDQPLKILIISQLSPIKKVSVAFEAVQQLLNRYPDIQVTAIDRGRYRDRYRNTPGVTFIPPVPYESMAGLINAHDIVIGQFLIGSMGMAELESMACGKPVVCSFNYNDWYPEPPPVFSTDQPKQVVEALSTLVEDSVLRCERGEQSHNWVNKYHSYINIAGRLEQIYRS